MCSLGSSHQGTYILCHSDNVAAVCHVNHLYASDLLVSHLLHCLALFMPLFDFHIHAVHIAGRLNIGADQLSHRLWQQKSDSLCGLPWLGGAVYFYHSVVHGGLTPLLSAGRSALPVTFFPFTSHGSSPVWNHSAPKPSDFQLQHLACAS